MSASGYKRTYSGQLANVRFTSESRHSNHDSGSGTFRCPLYPQKRTFPVLALTQLQKPLHRRRKKIGGLEGGRTASQEGLGE